MGCALALRATAVGSCQRTCCLKAHASKRDGLSMPRVRRGQTERIVKLGLALRPAQAAGALKRRQVTCGSDAEEPKARALLMNVFSVVTMRLAPK